MRATLHGHAAVAFADAMSVVLVGAACEPADAAATSAGAPGFVGAAAPLGGPDVRLSVAALREAMLSVLAEPADDPRAAAEVPALLVLRSQLDAAVSARLAAVDSGGSWALDGSVTSAAWLARRTSMSGQDSREQLRLARRLQEHPDVRGELAAGRISAQHASVCCRYLDRIERHLWPLQEPAFLAAAQLTDPATLAAELRARVIALAPLPAEQDAQTARDQRRFALARTLDGMWHISGLLDPENGHLLHTALTAQRRTDHTTGDTRSPGQRDADAVVHLARLALDRGELPATHRVRPHLLVLTPLDTYVRQSAPRPGEQRAGWATVPGSVPSVARYVDGEPITDRTLRRMACDAQVTRIVLSPAGLPLDVGRTQRTVPPQIWLAAVARDRGCIIAGCTSPPERCEAHHLRPFSHGGDTSLTNTGLLCVGANGHHHQLHDQQRVLTTKLGRRLGPDGYLDPDPPDPPGRQSREREGEDGDRQPDPEHVEPLDPDPPAAPVGRSPTAAEACCTQVDP